MHSDKNYHNYCLYHNELSKGHHTVVSINYITRQPLRISNHQALLLECIETAEAMILPAAAVRWRNEYVCRLYV